MRVPASNLASSRARGDRGAAPAARLATGMAAPAAWQMPSVHCAPCASAVLSHSGSGRHLDTRSAPWALQSFQSS